MRAIVASLSLVLCLSACSSTPDDRGDGEEACPSGTMRCDGACVSTGMDSRHCGTCGNACGENAFCVEGDCMKRCEPGKTRCGQENELCFDLESDSSHCGDCFHACETGETCTAGECVPRCGDTQMWCDGQCLDWNDPAHCGTCDRKCAENEVCNVGTCELHCDLGLDPCDGACVDLDRDDTNCGACGVACTGGRACAGGSCVCPAGTEACGGACVDTRSDATHCGECGKACDPGASCEDGVCSCPAGQERCDGVCVNTSTDAANCGACGDACTAGANAWSSCVGGECVMSCVDSRADCDGLASTGCESNPMTDVANCGACGHACAASETCTGGVCCGPGGAICGGACVDPQRDDRNCGGCGVTCLGLPGTTGGACDAGTCELACADLRGDCNGDVADGCERDLSADRFSCGACGNSCGAICSGGICRTLTLPGRSFFTTCALSSDGRVLCWGLNVCGQVGDGSGPQANCRPTGSVYVPNVTKPYEVVGLSSVAALFVGDYHNCAILSDGGAKCWGANDKGQLGAGDLAPHAAPVTVMDGGAPMQGVVAFGLTESSTCAVLDSGAVKCWGAGADGRLGNGETTDSTSPVAVLSGTTPVAGAVGVAAGAQHVCAILQGGTVACWGKNSYGQLGTGDTNAQSSAVAISGLTGVDQLSAAGFRTCARVGGGVKCWGQNLNGQAGDGTSGATSNKTSPVDVIGVTTAVSISAGVNHGCATLAGGQAACWGSNSFGQLGNGLTAFTQATPVQVLDPATGNPRQDIRAVSAGAAHTCMVLTDDQVTCWGLNIAGQLGDGSNTNSMVPVDLVW